MTTSSVAAFAGSYAEARAKFIDAAQTAGAALTRYPHDDRALGTDVAVLGRADASRRLVMVSGTHGVEGFAGSAVLINRLRQDATPSDLAVVMVHAINPWGFAHLSRCTEGNVDLNRNFVDHAAPRPENPGYAALHDILCPARWDDGARAAFRASGKGYAAEGKRRAWIDAIMRGQYGHPDGLNFGGHAPEWSNRTLRAIAARHLRGAEALVLIDWHTGLGAYGAASVLCLDPPESTAYARAREIFGAETDAVERLFEGEARPRYTGLLLDAARAEAGARTAIACAIEFGTKPLEPMIEAILLDRWLRLAAPATLPERDALAAEVKETFAPSEPVWQAAVIRSSEDLIQRAAGWLSSQR
jgi:predicted deacylase